MPNWCQNTVEITHEDPAKIQRLAQAMEENHFFEHVIPVPAILKDTTAPTQEGDEAAAEARRQETGYADWYDFCVNRWGTKWDVDCQGTVDVEDDYSVVRAAFDSAWAPPVGIYEELVEQGYTVTAYYYESGMGFVGKWQDGNDEYYEIGDADSKTVRGIIGDELDEHFGISDSMAEWEEENEEDLTRWVKEGAEQLEGRSAG